MKTSGSKSNSIIIMFWSIPSCSMIRAYKVKSDMLNLAMKNMKSVEVITNGDKTYKLKKIGIEAGKFFGLENIKGSMKKMILNINEIKIVTLL
ncbi:MAG: hypothetical protein IMY67_02355 [Bacteroidetes bacterium]|nr:hypothetical protein [Bacteroidota bacterium]